MGGASDNIVNVDIVVPNQTRYLGLIGNIAEQIAKELDGFTGDRDTLAYHLNLAVTEAMVNAIRYSPFERRREDRAGVHPHRRRKPMHPGLRSRPRLRSEHSAHARFRGIERTRTRDFLYTRLDGLGRLSQNGVRQCARNAQETDVTSTLRGNRLVRPRFPAEAL